MFSQSSIKKASFIAFVIIAVGGTVAYAAHSWGTYHWARQTNPFTLKLGDNVSGVWDDYLAEASSDWSQSGVLDTTVVSGGTNSKTCKGVDGRVEVCGSKYGRNGWLGLATIWMSGSHITKATTKVNDTYFNSAPYNTPAWRRLVMCQEIGHTFGLDHQDTDSSNANLGTCMDYTNNPSGPPSNEHPNAHDYEQLDTIYSHADDLTTVKQTVFGSGKSGDATDAGEFGRSLRQDSKGRTSLYARDLGDGEKVFTFIFWAD